MKRWLSSLPRNVPLTVITASSVNALSFARSLGRRNIPILLLDSDRHPAVHTRYAHVVKLPPSNADPAAWIDVLTEAGRALKTPGVLIPTSDVHTVLISEHQETLKPFFRFLVPPSAEVRSYVSKRFQIEHARRLRIPVPQTWFPESRAEVERRAAQTVYPCIVKPDRSHSAVAALAGRKLLIARSAQELVDAYASLAAGEVPCLVQEIIPGPDTELVGYLGFWNQEAVETAFITKRKLRQFPALFGNGSLQRTEVLPIIADLSRRLLKSLDYRGFASVEFKFDPRDESFRFIEFNPRSSAMNELAVVAGVDFPWIAYRTLIGDPPAPNRGPSFRTGVSCFNEEWDIQAYWELRKQREISFRRWCSSLRGAHPIIAARDDPGPLIAGIGRAARLLRSRRR
jgi:predicted ATP-grasp superfamily ATP-dependent carboligase